MRIRNDRSPACDSSVCTMCGEFCTNKVSAPIIEQVLHNGVKA